MSSTPQSTGSVPHEVKAYQSAYQDNIRNQANQFGERNFIGDRRHNIGGVAKGGALQGKRYKGIAVQTSVVGP